MAESKRLELAFRGEAPPDGGAELYLSFDDEGGHVDGYRVEGGVRSAGFAGAGSGWVAGPVVREFFRQLTHMDTMLAGQAGFSDIADEIAMTIFATDSRGHFAVRGTLTHYYPAPQSVTFQLDVPLSDVSRATKSLRSFLQ